MATESTTTGNARISMAQRDRGEGIVWRPSAELVQSSNLTAFMRRAGISSGGVEGYEELVARADENPEWFWNQVIEQCDIRFFHPCRRVLDTSKGVPWAAWCVDGTTNLVLNCLDKHRGTERWQKPALVWEGEDVAPRQWTYAELDAEVCRLAESLRALGYGRGDVVGLYMPTIPEASVAMLAVAKIGAIILPLFSGFGAQAMIARLHDGGAVAVITADGTRRRGREVPMKTILDEVAGEVPTLRHVVVFRNLGVPLAWNPRRDRWWHEICDGQPIDSPTEVMAADAPLMLVHTSGTTGRPKGTVLTHCGFTIKVAADLGLCVDYRVSDRMMWMSDMGWIIGPMMVASTLLLGATMVLAEGAPDYPDRARYWRLIQDHRVSILGIAPTIVRGFMSQGGAGVGDHDLSSLRVTVSTGEPWTPDAWHWMFEKVCDRRIPILNYSGGTEIGGGIISGTVLHPLKPCAFGGPMPGMGADVVDDDGVPVGRGGVGELVLRQPSIGLSRGLWHDPQRYMDSYWSRYPGLWWHGDRASIDTDGFWYIHGRSDDTLKIAGKRAGPAEIEALVMTTGKLADVVAIGVPDPVKGEAAVLAAVLLPGANAQAVEQELSDAVVAGLGTPFRPLAVLFIPDIPKTRNMKVMRRVVRAIYLGLPVGDLSSLMNPESIEGIAAAVASARERCAEQD